MFCLLYRTEGASVFSSSDSHDCYDKTFTLYVTMIVLYLVLGHYW